MSWSFSPLCLLQASLAYWSPLGGELAVTVEGFFGYQVKSVIFTLHGKPANRHKQYLSINNQFSNELSAALELFIHSLLFPPLFLSWSRLSKRLNKIISHGTDLYTKSRVIGLIEVI